MSTSLEAIEPETGREHGAFEASRNLLRNIDILRRALEERESKGLNRIVDPDTLNVFVALSNDESFFDPEKPMQKEALFAWLESFSRAIDEIGRAPRERALVDDVESLNALGQSLSNMEQALDPIFEYLDGLGLDDEERQKAEGLHARLAADIQDRARFFAKKMGALLAYQRS